MITPALKIRSSQCDRCGSYCPRPKKARHQEREFFTMFGEKPAVCDDYRARMAHWQDREAA